MNKKRINDWILPAQEAIKDNGMVENGVINKTYRGQISAFGAAVVMGSLKSSIAFFSDSDKASVDRTKLIKAMYQLITRKANAEPGEIFQYVCDHDGYATEEKFTDASVAIKLALNFYKLVDDPPKYKNDDTKKDAENNANEDAKEGQGDE